MFSKLPKTSLSNFALRNLFPVKDEVPKKDMPKNLRPWEKFDWPEEREQAMYFEWGVHCSRTQKPDCAENYYERAIKLRNSDGNSLFHLSQCQREMAKTKLAFENSKKAVVCEARNPKTDREYCRCLHDMNEFELAKAKTCEKSRKYAGSKSVTFTRLAEVIDDNVRDCFGKPCSDFFLNHQHVLPEVQSYHHKKLTPDKRPLWKIMQEQGKCDIQSVLEKEVEKLHPRENARRKLASKVYYQKYLPYSWQDTLFQHDLEKDDEYLSSVFSESEPALRKLLKTKNEAVRKFVKMLHARSPLYNEFKYKIENKKLSNWMHEKHLNFVQLQTRRTMINILNTIKNLRKRGSIEKLTAFVEKTMGDYIIVKTQRVAPWKQEFLIEVYNTLALAFADKYAIPTELKDYGDVNALETLFHIEPSKETLAPIEFVFGNKFSQIDSSSVNLAHERKRHFLDRMEKRLHFAKEPIERAYIYHEIARAHFKTGNFGECEFVAQKGVREASNTTANMVWALLCSLLIVKSNVCTARREKCADALELAGNFAVHLGCDRIIDFIDLAKCFNQAKMLRFKSVDLSDSRKSKSKSIDSNMSAKSKVDSIRSSQNLLHN